LGTDLALYSVTEKSSNKNYHLDEIKLCDFLRVRKSMSRQTVAKPDNTKMYFMSHSRKTIHIFQKSAEKGFSVT